MKGREERGGEDGEEGKSDGGVTIVLYCKP